jgi:hypothetical protein
MRGMATDSARASRPLRQPWSPTGIRRSFLTLAPAFFIACKVPILAEANFEEDQQQSSGESCRHQDDREDFPRHSLDQGGARTARDNKRDGRPKRDDAQPGGHAFNGIRKSARACSTISGASQAAVTVSGGRHQLDPTSSGLTHCRSGLVLPPGDARVYGHRPPPGEAIHLWR